MDNKLKILLVLGLLLVGVGVVKIIVDYQTQVEKCFFNGWVVGGGLVKLVHEDYEFAKEAYEKGLTIEIKDRVIYINEKPLPFYGIYYDTTECVYTENYYFHYDPKTGKYIEEVN